jgi:hypothetical protein
MSKETGASSLAAVSALVSYSVSEGSHNLRDLTTFEEHH